MNHSIVNPNKVAITVQVLPANKSVTTHSPAVTTELIAQVIFL
jgi:hypothetical protein